MNAARIVVLAGILLLPAFAVEGAKAGNFVVLKEGTPVVVKMADDFAGAAMAAGGKAPVFVAEKVTKEGFVLIAAGEPVEATFLAGEGKDEGVGRLKIASVQSVDGQDVMLRATPEGPVSVDGKDAAGPLTIIVIEEKRQISEERTFTVYLADSYFIED